MLEGIRSFYENASASKWVNSELGESFSVEVGVRQGCVMSPWLFNIYIDGCVREIKVRVDNTNDSFLQHRYSPLASRYTVEEEVPALLVATHV